MVSDSISREREKKVKWFQWSVLIIEIALDKYLIQEYIGKLLDSELSTIKKNYHSET